MVWQTLKGYSKYEINTAYPHYIRDKRKLRVISMYVERNGYYRLNLKPDSDKDTPKPYQHTLIAKQWLDNDDVEHKTQVDHINRDRVDNHVYNLRWTTPSENSSNKQGYKGDVYKYKRELPDDVRGYHGHGIDLYKLDGEYYVLNGLNKLYERLIKRVDKNNKPYIDVYNIYDSIVRVYVADH